MAGKNKKLILFFLKCQEKTKKLIYFLTNRQENTHKKRIVRQKIRMDTVKLKKQG